MQEEMGGYEKIAQIALTMFEEIRGDPNLSQFFSYTGTEKHACRFA
jgi:truncated hemoglobin YjbI